MLRWILGGLAALIVLGLGACAWINRALHRDLATSLQAAAAWPIECSEKTTTLVQRWSFSGYSVSCYRGLNEWGAGEGSHGPFLGFEKGRLSISGEHRDGLSSGVWTYYGEAGNIIQTITYDEFGQEVSRTTSE